MIDNWDELERTALSCQNCRLCATRSHVVFGTGSKTAPVLFCGEAPGQNEDLQGEPFVGRGGQFLDKLLMHVELSRQDDIYITNLVKCRPPKNRNPEKDEQEACIGYLLNQLALIRPKLIVCLGRVAACALISADFKVSTQHGQFFEKDGRILVGTYHPASVLRNPIQKPAVLDDFIKIREKLDELTAAEKTS